MNGACPAILSVSNWRLPFQPMDLARRILVAIIGERARRLRYPTLLLLTALAFLVDVLVPDLLPFVDEILLGLATLVLSRIREREGDGSSG